MKQTYENKPVDSRGSKNLKKKHKGVNKGAKAALAFQIIFTIALGGIALAPQLSALFAFIFGAFLVIAVIFVTLITAGIPWFTSDSFVKGWKNAFTACGKMFEGPQVILDALRDKIIWLSILLLVLSSVGLIVNAVQFGKKKNNKALFITSCVFIGLALINVLIAIPLYLNN